LIGCGKLQKDRAGIATNDFPFTWVGYNIPILPWKHATEKTKAKREAKLAQSRRGGANLRVCQRHHQNSQKVGGTNEKTLKRKKVKKRGQVRCLGGKGHTEGIGNRLKKSKRLLGTNRFQNQASPQEWLGLIILVDQGGTHRVTSDLNKLVKGTREKKTQS